MRAELARVLAHAAGGRGMVLGQMLDLEAEKRGEPPHMTAAHVRRLQSLKTGALIAAACEAGAVLAGAADEQRAALRRYGENLGLAFQIADDLLDAEGDAAAMGKATGKDSAAGKATLVGLIGVEEARAQLAAAVRQCRARACSSSATKARRPDRGRALRRQPRALSRHKPKAPLAVQETP